MVKGSRYKKKQKNPRGVNKWQSKFKIQPFWTTNRSKFPIRFTIQTSRILRTALEQFEASNKKNRIKNIG